MSPEQFSSKPAKLLVADGVLRPVSTKANSGAAPISLGPRREGDAAAAALRAWYTASLTPLRGAGIACLICGIAALICGSADMSTTAGTCMCVATPDRATAAPCGVAVCVEALANIAAHVRAANKQTVDF